MKVTKRIEGQKMIFAVEGRVDSTTAPALERAVGEISRDVCRDVDFDFSELEYISSAGLRVLVMCRKKLSDGTIRILNANEGVRSVLESTGMDSLMEICEEDTSAEGEEDQAATFAGNVERMPFRDILKYRAETVPDKEIITFYDVHVSWKDLDRLSDVFAAEMAAGGVGQHTHVGICGMNSISWVAAFFAVQKLGGIAVLLNFLLKPSELAMFTKIGGVTHLCCGDIPARLDNPNYIDEVLADENCQVEKVFDINSRVDIQAKGKQAAAELVKQSGMATKAKAVLAGVTARFSADADDSQSQSASLKAILPEVEVEPDDPAVMIFTSGTTSLPKAVLFSSANLLSLSGATAGLMNMTPDDRICAAIPMFHIFSAVANLFLSLTFDVPMYIPDIPKPEPIIKCVSKYHCTILHGVPTIFLAMIANPAFKENDLSSLRVGYLGGAPITAPQLENLRQALPGMHLGVGYGMTEVGIVAATLYDETDEHILNTVGKPLFDNLLVRAVHPDTGLPCGTGEEGELVFKSENQMVCYYKLPIDKQPIDEAGWLHTGDLGFVAEDGYIHLTGRLKDLIIRSGENIAPKEVADAICSHPAIADAVVVGIPSELRGEEVATGLIMNEGMSVTDEELKEYLKDHLANFKIPVLFVRYDRFPMLPNGKPDMRKLKEEIAEKAKEIK